MYCGSRKMSPEQKGSIAARALHGVVICLIVSYASSLPLPVDASTSVELAFATGARTDEQRAFDEQFRPDMLLKYARVQRGMRIAQWHASDAYFLEVMQSVVGEHGAVFAVNAAGSIAKTDIGRGTGARPPVEGEAMPEDGSLHAAFLLYDVHAQMADLQVFEALHRRVLQALRPGGYYVVVDSQADPEMEAADARALRRVHSSIVESKLERLGFERSGEARFLSNPRDEHDTAVVDVASRSTADRFVLRFRKPLPPREPAMSSGW